MIGLKTINNRVNFFDSDGSLVKNAWRNVSGRSFHLNDAGIVNQTTLNHTWFSQLNVGAPNGCEAAALQIALSVKGVYTSMQTIYNMTGYGYYGNPDTNFYGNPWSHGASPTLTVTARKLAEATKNLYAGIGNMTGATVADVEREIGLGNAVVTWADYYWQLNRGFHIMAIVGMDENRFLISDPYSTTKREYWVSKSTWAYINSTESAQGWNLAKSMNLVVR